MTQIVPNPKILGHRVRAVFIDETIVVPDRNRRPLKEHRTCARCGVTKPLTEECFEPKVGRKSAFRGVCRKCRNWQKRENKRNRKDDE